MQTSIPANKASVIEIGVAQAKRQLTKVNRLLSLWVPLPSVDVDFLHEALEYLSDGGVLGSKDQAHLDILWECHAELVR